MCYIWCGIFPLDFTTTIDIVPQYTCIIYKYNNNTLVMYMSTYAGPN